MRHYLRYLAVLSFLLPVPLGAAAAEAPGVVASIPPVHSLVAAVMKGVGEPYLLVDGAASPHDFSLSPRAARSLQTARAVFWVGPNLEAFLAKPLRALPRHAKVEALAAHVRLLDVRGGAWETHEHEHEHEAAHEKHGAAHDGDGRRGDHEGEHDKDMHIWLDPGNAAAMVGAIVATMQAVDPANGPAYAENGAALRRRLAALDAALAETLAPVKSAPYVVFHDAYRYFERHYGLNAIGSITVSPDRGPGVKRLQDIRAKIRATGARCVFAEPQFPPALVATVVEGTGAKPGTLDPLGAAIPPGPDAYFTLMESLAASLRDCLVS